MFMQLVLSKFHPACHNIVNGIKPGSDSRKTDKHAVDCSKAVFEFGPCFVMQYLVSF